MLNRFSNFVIQNKNILMLFSAMLYALALTSVLIDSVLLVSIILTCIFLILILKGVFPIKYILVWTILFYLGVINTSFRLKDVDSLLNLAPVNSKIFGTIISIPQGANEGKLKFFFKVDKIKFGSVEKEFKKEKVLVTINSLEEIPALKIYNYAILEGRLSTPFKAGNPSQFDYGNYLRNHDAYAVFYAKSCKLLDIKPTFGANLLQKISDYREYVISLHSKYIQSPYLEILGGIVFGDDAVSPTKEIKKSFANSGLLHILAASGMNVAFIYGFFFWILSQLRVNFKSSIILSMLMVIIYTFMTGLGASIIRAAGMLLFVLVGKLIDRDAHSISLLSFVGLLMLIYNPLFINDVGFQLSFIVTFGILLMSPTVLRSDNKIINYIIGVVSIPIIAQLWVIPIQIYYFNNISIYSVFANIMSVPILAVISFGGFISSLLSSIAPIADLICKIFDIVLNPLLVVLVNISDFWGHLPNSAIQTAHPTIAQLLVYYSLLLSITALLYKDMREKYLKKILVSIVLFLTLLLITFIPFKTAQLSILVFDVGNADCFLIKTPQNEYILIDSGKSGYKGGKSQAEMIVLKYLKDRGIKDVDTIIVTHFDNDHCGGVVDLVESLQVKRVFVNNLNHDSKAAKAIYKSVKSNDTELILAENNQTIYDRNGLSLTNLLGVSSDSDNENSVITFLKYKKFTMLFTGDAGIEGITEVLSYLPKNINILKVPHHGAIGGLNKALVDYLAPEYSIISVGENKFGHPALYTLSLLRESKVLRTDVHNSILIKVNKKGYDVLTYDMKKRKYL